MELNLKDKSALITGSSQGIGFAIAQSLQSEGCKVILNGRNESRLKTAKKKLKNPSNYFIADVTDNKKCQDLVNFTIKNNKKLDILVCNVGSGKSSPTGKETPKDWEEMLKTNFFSTTNMIQAAEKELKKSKGTIICISSIAGIQITDAPVTYYASKAALNAYVKGISRSLAKKGIRINAVAPGNILFPGSVWQKKLNENPKEVKRLLENEVALKRLGQPDDVASLVTFLSSSRSSFITGSIFVVDGGQLK